MSRRKGMVSRELLVEGEYALQAKKNEEERIRDQLADQQSYHPGATREDAKQSLRWLDAEIHEAEMFQRMASKN